MQNQNRKLKVSFNSPVILGFSIACFIVLVMGYVTKNYTMRTFFCVYRSSLLSPLTYVRMFGHVLGHANWQHFLSNITLLLVIGPMLEEKYGSSNILFVILATALITGIAHMLFFPRSSLLGASGVVFAMILLSSLTSIREGTIPLTFILVALIYIGGEVYSGMFVQDNISNFTHILGGVTGSGLGYVMHKNKMNKY